MFDIAEKRLAWITVEVPAFVSEGDKPGKNTTKTFEVKVELIDREEYREKFQRPDSDVDPEGAAAFDARTEMDAVKAVAHDWRGVAANGKPVPFTDDNIMAALRVPNVAEAFGTAYYDAWRGQAKIRLGNSNGSAQNGPVSAAESE